MAAAEDGHDREKSPTVTVTVVLVSKPPLASSEARWRAFLGAALEKVASIGGAATWHRDPKPPFAHAAGPDRGVPDDGADEPEPGELGVERLDRWRESVGEAQALLRTAREAAEEPWACSSESEVASAGVATGSYSAASAVAAAARALASRAEPGSVLIDERTRNLGADLLLLERLEPLAFRVLAILGDEGAAAERRFDERQGGQDEAGVSERRSALALVETIAAAMAAVAGLAAWVGVVGGATLWARLDAAGVPASEAVSLLPHQRLVTEGLRTLALPLVAGAIVAGATFWFVHWFGEEKLRSDFGEVRHGLGQLLRETAGRAVVIVVLVVLLGFFAFAWWVLTIGLWWGISLALSLLALFVVVSVLIADDSLHGLALPGWVFVATVLWSGLASFIYEAGAREPRLETAQVELNRPPTPASGLFVGRAGAVVLLAQHGGKAGPCGLRLLPASSVTTILIGVPAEENTGLNSEQCLPPAAEPNGTAGSDNGPSGTSTAGRGDTVDEGGGAETGPPPTSAPPPETEEESEPHTIVDTITSPPIAPASLPGARAFGEKISIPVTSVQLPSRLQIEEVRVTRSATDVLLTVIVEDTEGRRVRHADVFVVTTNRRPLAPRTARIRSCFDGRAYVRFKVRNGQAILRRVVVLVRAHRPLEPPLAGVSGRRLVSLRLDLATRTSGELGHRPPRPCHS